MARTGIFRLIMTAALAAAFCLSARAQEGEVLLPVSVNDVAKGNFTVIVRGNDVIMRVEDLAAAGVVGPTWDRLRTLSQIEESTPSIDGAGTVALSRLAPWVTFEFNEAELTVAIHVDPRMLEISRLSLNNQRPRDLEYASNPSTFLNYAVNSRGAHDVGFFGELGASVRGDLLYSSFSRSANGPLLRGLTNFTIDQRSSLRRWIAGDAPVTTDTLGGSALIGGITVSRNYTLDPYFIRFPSLSISGTALTPSRVDVYVNGVLVQQLDVQPGQFDLRNIPGTAGAGNTRVIVKDAFGNERESVTPFYYSTSVLARGLSEYIYSTGAVRRDLTASFDYSDAALVGYHRYGLTDHITLGGRIEATRGFWSGGPNAAFRTRIGDLDFSAAASGGSGKSGEAGEAGYRFLSRYVSFGGSFRTFSSEYENLSLVATTDRVKRDANAFVAFLLRGASLSLQWTLSDALSTGRIERLTALTNFSLTQRVGAFVSVGAAEQGGQRHGEYFAGLSFFLGRIGTANVSVARTTSGTETVTEIQKPLPIGPGFAYRLQSRLDADQQRSGSATLQYQTNFGRYDATFTNPGASTPLLSASGALVWAGNTFMLTRAVQDSFAIVRVPGVPNVRVYTSNQLVGRTGRDGDLLVPNLLSYYGNRLRIEDKDIPLDYEVRGVERTIAPPYRGGAVVDFPVSRVVSVMGTVAISTGVDQFVPAFGEITLTRETVSYTSPLGHDAEFYFENVPPGPYAATVTHSGGRCTFSLTIPDTRESVVTMPRQTCSREAKKP